MSEPATKPATLVKGGKAYLRDKHDNFFSVDPSAANAVIAEGDSFAVTPEQLAEHEREKKNSGLGAKIKTGAESFGAAAIDTLQAPIALPLRLGAAALGKGDPLEHLSGRATIENLASIFGGDEGGVIKPGEFGGQTGESYAREYGENARARAEANPLSALAGNIAGSLAAGGALSGGAGAIGGAAGKALGGGAAARAAGALTAGALEGAAFGQAQAADEAYLENIPLSAEKLIASMGWGAVLGGGVSLAAHGAGALLRKGSRGATPIDSPRVSVADDAADDWLRARPANDVTAAAEDVTKIAGPEARAVAAEERAAAAEARTAAEDVTKVAGPEARAMAAEERAAAADTQVGPRPVDSAPLPKTEPLPPPAEAAAMPTAGLEAGSRTAAEGAALPGAAAALGPEAAVLGAVGKEPGVLRELASDVARKALGAKNAKIVEGVFSGSGKAMIEGARELAEHYTGEAIGAIAGGLIGGPVGALAGAALSKLVERHTGQAAANIAQRLAASLDGKIDQGLGAFFRESTQRAQAGATGLGKAAPVPLKRLATPSAVDAFQGKSTDLQDAYQKRVAELTDATREMGAGMRTATLKAMGGAGDAMPRLAAAATGTASKGAQYLETQLPAGTKAPTMFQPSRTYQPSDLQIREFAQKWSAVANPLSVIDDLRRGTVTHAQIDAIKNVYPELYSEVRIKALERVREIDESGARMALNDRLALDLFLDLGGAGEPTLAPGFVDRMTKAQAAKAEQVAQGTPGSSGAGLDKIGKSRVSDAQRALGG